MADSMRAPAAVRQSLADDLAPPSGSTLVDQALATLRGCVSDLGWTLDALQADMGKDKAYIHRVLNGDKPLTLEFLIALPDEIEALWHSRTAEAFGRIVVAPVEGRDAMNALVAGLFGVLAPGLPGKATRMAKATIAPHARKAAR